MVRPRPHLGCEACRTGAVSGTWPPPDRLGPSADGWAFLHLCGECGAYWVFEVRVAYPISSEDAAVEYPALIPQADEQRRE